MTESNLQCHQIKICWKKMKTSSNTRNFFILTLLVELQMSFIVSVSVKTSCKQNSAMHE